MAAILTAWSHPGSAIGESKPAPEPLRLVQALINTIDRESGQDRLADPTDAAPWLADNGLLPVGATLSDDDRRTVVALREALRALVIHNTGGPPPGTAALAPLRRIADSGRAVATLGDEGRVRLEPAGVSLTGPTARLAADRQGCAGRRDVGTPQGVCERGVPVGVLRPFPQPWRYLVRNGHVRKQAQEPRVQGPQSGLTAKA